MQEKEKIIIETNTDKNIEISDDKSKPIEEQKKQTKDKNKIKPIINQIFILIIIIGIIYFISNKIFVSKAIVNGPSMEPTYYDGEVVHSKTVKINEIKRGDVILLYPQTIFIGPIYIKRVVAIPGDTVQIKDGKLYVNEEEIKSTFPDMEYSGVAENKITLDESSFFVLGDNRNNSNDSRQLGPISFSHIIGIVKTTV